MAVRREKVLLELEDHFSREMLKPIGATKALDAALNDLSGSSVQTSRSQESVAKSTTTAGGAAEKASKKTKDYSLSMAIADEKAARLRRSLRDQAKAYLDVGDAIDSQGGSLARNQRDLDRYSGRIRLIGEAITVLGPGLVPMGAGLVPVLSGVAAGLTAAAGAAGVAVLAFSGVGDALDAMDEYQLEPTTENLQAMRQALNDLGPAGEQFARFIDSLDPGFKDLQNVARGGLFPGIEEGIRALEPLLPQVRRIVAEIADGLGRLSAEAGNALAGDGFAAFMDFLEADARPIMIGFARATGHLVEGLANLTVAFTPLSMSFAAGLERSMHSFAGWSANLSETDGFRDFVAYVQESGPQLLAFLGALSDMFVGVATAVAPFGQTVLTTLTALADVVTAIAKSPIGPELFTAAAGFVALSRATKILGPGLSSLSEAFLDLQTSPNRAATAVERFGRAGRVVAGAAGMGLLLTSLHETNDGLRSLEAIAGGALAGFSVGLGPWGAAVGAGVGALTLLGNSSRENTAYIEAMTASLNKQTGAVTDNSSTIAAKAAEDAGLLKMADQMGISLDLVTQAAMGNKDAMATLDSQIQSYRDSLGTVSAYDTAGAQAMQLKLDAANGLSSGVRALAGDTDSATASARRLAEATGKAGDAAVSQGAKMARQAENLKAARSAARATARGFIGLGDSLNDSKVSLNDWISQLQQQAQALRAFANNAAKAAERGLDKGLIKSLKAAGPDGAMRMKQLANATEAELNRANRAWRDGQKAIKDYARITVPGPRLNMKPAQAQAKRLRKEIEALGELKAKPTIDADKKPAMAKIEAVQAAKIADKTFTISARVVGPMPGKMEWDTGGFTGHGRRLDAAGIVHRGEVVLPQDVVKRDKSHLMSRYGFLPNMRALGDLPGYAEGGAVGIKPQGTLEDRLAVTQALQEIRDLRRDLRAVVKKGKHKGEHVVRGLDRELAELQLKEAHKNLAAAENREKREREAARKEHLMDRYRAALGKELDRETAARDKLSEAVDRNQAEVDRLTGLYDNLASTIRSSLEVDAFAMVPGVKNENPWASSVASTEDRMPTIDEAIGRLNKGTGDAYDFIRGATTLSGVLSGAALESVLSQGLDVVNMMAAQGPDRLREYQSAFDANAFAKGSAGEIGANSVYGRDLAKSEALLSSSLAMQERQTLVMEAVQARMDAVSSSTEATAQVLREAIVYLSRTADGVDDLGGKVKSGHRGKR